MATIQPTETEAQGGTSYYWDEVTESDTAAAVQIDGGKYTMTVEGSFGGGSIEGQYGQQSANVASIDSTNLTFSAYGSYNIEVGRGWFQPVRSGGSSMDVNITLTPIPR